MAKNILVVGTLAFDTIETPFGKKEKILGGSANYFSIASSLFTKIELSAIVGRDFPQGHLKYLNKRGIGTSNVEIASGETFHWCGKYQGAMNEAETLATYLNVLTEYSPKFDDKAKKCEILFLANVDPVHQYDVIEAAKNAKIVVSDTMNFWINTKPDALKKVLKRTTILIINETEARMLSKEHNIILAAKKVIEMGPEILVIKRGEYGAVLFKKGGNIFYVPAYPVENVIDPTGAGDTFAGGFIGYLATSKDPLSFNEMKKAMLYGAVSASFTVQDFGIEAISSTTKKDIDKRFQELVSMLSIK